MHAQAYGRVELQWRTTLWENLGVLAPRVVEATAPLSFEAVGAAYGYVLYSTTLSPCTPFSAPAARRSSTSGGRAFGVREEMGEEIYYDSDAVRSVGCTWYWGGGGEGVGKEEGGGRVVAAGKGSMASDLVNISVDRVHDRAHVFLGRRLVGVWERGLGGCTWIQVKRLAAHTLLPCLLPPPPLLSPPSNLLNPFEVSFSLLFFSLLCNPLCLFFLSLPPSPCSILLTLPPPWSLLSLAHT